MTTSWPAPHPKFGPALDLAAAARLLGIGANAIDVALNRTRAGTARVPFPEPDGTATTEKGYPTRFWWQARIEAYQAARRRAGGSRREITDHDIERIRRLHVDGKGVTAIVAATGWSAATVSRIVNNKAHTPGETP